MTTLSTKTAATTPLPPAPDPTTLERINAAIQTYSQELYNILCPAIIQTIPEWFSVALKVVQIDPNPDHRQVYKATPGSEDLSLGKVALANLAAAAGISWKWSASGRVDDGRDPNRIRYRAVGSMIDLSGERRELMGEKEIDLVAIQAELWRNYEKKATSYEQFIPAERKKRMLREDEIQDWVREKTLNDLIQMKKHALARAQTGAMERVVRDALGLKSSYTPQELAKPFVVPRLIFSPDTKDPDVKMFHLALKAGVIEELYGNQRGAQMLPILHMGQDTKTGDIIDMVSGLVMDEGNEPEPAKALIEGNQKVASVAPATAAVSSQANSSDTNEGESCFREQTSAASTPPAPDLWEVAWNEAETREAKEAVLQKMLLAKGKKEEDLTKPLARFSPPGLQAIFDSLFKLPGGGAK